MIRKTPWRFVQLFTFVVLVFSLSALVEGRTISAPAVSDELPNVTLQSGTIENLEYLIEDVTPQRPSQLADNRSDQWTAVSKGPLYLGETDKFVWVRFHLQPESGLQEWVLRVDWALINHIELHLRNSDSGEWIQSDSIVNWDTRSGIDRVPFFFPLQLPENAGVDVYLRVQSEHKFLLPASLLTAEEYDDYKFERNIKIGLFYGIILGLLVYNLFLYVFVRDIIYAVYCLYVASIILYTLVMTGIGPAYIWFGHSWINSDAFKIFPSVSFLAAVVFIRVFLDIKKYGGICLWFSNLAIVTWLGLIIVILLPGLSIGQQVYDLAGLLSPVMGLSMSLYLWYRGNLSAKYMTVAWFPLLVSTFVLMLSLTGVISNVSQVLDFQSISFVFEVLMLSIALAERINRERRERITAQEMALHYSEEMLSAQEREAVANLKAMTAEHRANTELASLVEERTVELQLTMAELEAANKALATLSNTDGLTGLANRRHFDEALEIALSGAIRHKRFLSLIMFDLDYFKKLNDTYGHLVGDECLKYAAKSVSELVSRSEDTVARFGGEEFIAVLPSTDPESALKISENIRQAIENIEFVHESDVVKFTASFGVTGGVPTPDISSKYLLECVDQALYSAKTNGRNRVEFRKFHLAIDIE